MKLARLVLSLPVTVVVSVLRSEVDSKALSQKKGLETVIGNASNLQLSRYIPSELEISQDKRRSDKGENVTCTKDLGQRVSTWLDEVALIKPKDVGVFSIINDTRLHKVRLLEPLVLGLLDPRLRCPDFAPPNWSINLKLEQKMYAFLSKDFLLLPTGPDAIDNGGHKYFFDLGASWYNGRNPAADPNETEGWGASGKWFIEEYEKRGIKFDFLFMWEQGPSREQYINSGLPERFHNKLAYYHGRINASDSESNPLRVLRQKCSVDDYCVLKVDFDTPEVEIALIDKLLADNSTLSLVDEFFWDPNGLSPEKHYRTIRRLRELGVNAHSWV